MLHSPTSGTLSKVCPELRLLHDTHPGTFCYNQNTHEMLACEGGLKTRETNPLWHTWDNGGKSRGRIFLQPHSRVLPEPGLSSWLPDFWAWAISMMPSSRFTLFLLLCGARIRNATIWLNGEKVWARRHPDLGLRLDAHWLCDRGSPRRSLRLDFFTEKGGTIMLIVCVCVRARARV